MIPSTFSASRKSQGPTNVANEYDKLIERVKDGDFIYLLYSIASHQLGDNVALNQGSRFFIICHIHNHTGYNQ